jgi:hypothetical protein
MTTLIEQLRQLAEWVREYQEGMGSPSQRIGVDDIDHELIKQAAATITDLVAALEAIHKKAKMMREASKYAGPREYEDRQDLYRVWVKANYHNGKDLMKVTSAALAAIRTPPLSGQE